jgi:hypothetical protein
MTPKEKAEELVERFSLVIPFQDTYYSEEEMYKELKKGAKQCALMCVDELFKSTFVQNNTYNYWAEVKQEINKI